MKRLSPDAYKDRLNALRREMGAAGIDMYYVSCSDFHMSEYISDYFKCREYLSGFDGSNGEMVITGDRAYLWTDGRYFIQAEEQLKGTEIKLMKMGEPDVPKLTDFIKDNISEGHSLGFDGRCVPFSVYEKLSENLKDKNIKIVSDTDLVGKIWEDRPGPPKGKAWLLDEKYSGNSYEDRLSKLREALKKKKTDGLVLTSLDDIAWLYGFRGDDIEYNPVTLSYAYISETESVLFMEDEKASDIKDSLQKKKAAIKGYDEIFDYLRMLNNVSACLSNTEGRDGINMHASEGKISISIDPDCVSARVAKSLPENVKLIKELSPVAQLKSCKNPTEIENERQAHISDGAALTHILYDLKQLTGTPELNDGKITELDIAERLLSYRKEAEDFIEESFAPIVATGSHGAIVHYEPYPETNAVIKEGDMVLLDTGGQYLRGTTDVTRTVIVGKPTDKMKRYYTAVLKGNIALSELVFKKGTSGKTLDLIARKHLWDIGIDYNHGTGHGVGFLLNVHEGPQNISYNSSKAEPFKIGMITSDEPGVYIEGEFGIRIENMTVCEERKKTEFGEFLGFDVLTLAPYDRDLIDTDMLTEEEIRVIDAYHEKVYQKLAGFFDEKKASWLRDITRPLIDF